MRNLSQHLTRRRLLKLAGLVGGSIGMSGVLSNYFGKTRARDTDNAQILTPPKSIKTEDLQFSEYQFETITVDRQGKLINRRQKTAKYWTETLSQGNPLEMVYIPGNSFLMGSPQTERGDLTRSEKPQHQVKLKEFLIGKYPVTQAQWQAISKLPKINLEMPPAPSHFRDDNFPNLPVERVSWYEAVEFCQRLSQLTGKDYRLPSESQWEYACRAETTTPFNCGETLTSEWANYFASYEPYAEELPSQYRIRTLPVGSFAPNAFGLYDTHGNIGEWCADLWHKNYKGEPPVDGSAWLDIDTRLSRFSQSARLVRGGSWGDEARHCRSANRTFCSPDKRYSVLGFRVMMTIG